jgi:hypothetical protein
MPALAQRRSSSFEALPPWPFAIFQIGVIEHIAQNAGTNCHDAPYLSLGKLHCCAFSSPSSDVQK